MINESTRPSDTEIVRRIMDGDTNAYESLMTRHRDLILKLVKRHVPHSEVEETVQNAFIRAYRSLPTFKGKGDFRRWLSAVAVRTCYDYWRKSYKSMEVPLSSLTEKHQEWLEKALSDQSKQSLHEKGLQDEAREILDWALGKLPAEEKMVLELVYLEGLSGRDAADLLGWSVSNVKIRSFRARKKLKKLLTETLNK